MHHPVSQNATGLHQDFRTQYPRRPVLLSFAQTICETRPVRSPILFILPLLAIIAASLGASRLLDAAPTRAIGPAEPTGYEILVFERDACLTCRLFRRDVAPRYTASIRGQVAPLRYIDIATETDAARSHPALARPLRMIPTAVIVEDGREFARIEGYTGPDSFFKMVAWAFTNHKDGSGPDPIRNLGPITRP